jgi:homoserine dehydrogenase
VFTLAASLINSICGRAHNERRNRNFNGTAMHPMINTAVKAARRAAAIINRASFDIDQLRVTHKSHNDFVTEVDQAAERAIIDVLTQAYPDHAILAEESGASANLHDDNENVWIIDPLDGTTNFILSEMRSKGLGFDAVLQEAQRLGYAEADPTFDIEGIDAAHKLTLMSAIAFGVPVQFDRAYVEGIPALQAADIRYAEQLGYRIKLLGVTRRRAQGIELRVHPTLVPSKRLIANVEGAMNAVMVQADAVGTTLYYGKGAGAEPTASAVIADLVDVTRLHTADPDHRVPHLAFQPDALAATPILGIEEVITAFYLRLQVVDQPGVLARITGILAENNISIDALLQRESAEGEAQTDVIILTHNTVEGQMNHAIQAMQVLSTVLSPIVRIRKEELH